MVKVKQYSIKKFKGELEKLSKYCRIDVQRLNDRISVYDIESSIRNVDMVCVEDREKDLVECYML